MQETAYNGGELGSIPGFGRCPGERNGTLSQLLHYILFYQNIILYDICVVKP